MSSRRRPIPSKSDAQLKWEANRPSVLIELMTVAADHAVVTVQKNGDSALIHLEWLCPDFRWIPEAELERVPDLDTDGATTLGFTCQESDARMLRYELDARIQVAHANATGLLAAQTAWDALTPQQRLALKLGTRPR